MANATPQAHDAVARLLTTAANEEGLEVERLGFDEIMLRQLAGLYVLTHDLMPGALLLETARTLVTEQQKINDRSFTHGRPASIQ
jgi:hypothetical protein